MIVNQIDREIDIYKNTPKARFRKDYDPKEVDLLAEDEEEMVGNPFREVIVMSFKTRSSNQGIINNVFFDRILSSIPKNELLKDLMCNVPVPNMIRSHHNIVHQSMVDFVLLETLNVSY